MIKLDKITLSFKKTIFKDFSYFFNDKGLYYLIGPSGCGKTTLLRLLYLNKYKYTGNIYFGEQNIKELSITEIEKVRNDICYIPARDNCFKSKSVDENYHLILGEDYNESLVNDVLKKAKLEKYKNRKVKTLSMGERQRFLLSIPLLMNKRIILLDELFSNLDEQNAVLFKAIYEELSTEKLIIIVEHEIKNISDKGIIIDFKNLESVETKEKCRYEVNKKIKNKKYKFPIVRLSLYFLILFFMCLALSVSKIYDNTYMDVTEAKMKAYFNSAPIVYCHSAEKADKLGLADYKIDCYYTSDLPLPNAAIVEELYYNGENHTLKDNTIYIINYNDSGNLLHQYDITDGKKLDNGITIKLIDVNEQFDRIGITGPYFMNENTANIYFNYRLEYFKDTDSYVYASSKILESYNIIKDFSDVENKLDLNDYKLADDYFIAPFPYLEEKFGLSSEEYFQILAGTIEKEFTFDFPINGVVLSKTYKLLPKQIHVITLFPMVILPENAYSMISPYKDEKPVDLLVKKDVRYYCLKDTEECRRIVLKYNSLTLDYELLNYDDYQLRYNDYVAKIDTFRIIQFIFIGIALVLLIISSIILDLNSRLLFLYNYKIKYLTQKNLIISAIGFILFAILSVVFMKIMIETIFSSIYTIYHLSLTMFIEAFIYGVAFFIVSSLIVIFKNRYSILHVR